MLNKKQNKNHILESIIGISQSDLKKYEKKEIEEVIQQYIIHLKKEYNIQIYSVDFHYDEGYVKDNEKNRNIHIHIIHSNINETNGKSFTRELYQKSTKNQKGLDFIQKDIEDFFCDKLKGFERQKKDSLIKKHIENMNDYKKIIKVVNEQQETIKKLQETIVQQQNTINTQQEQIDTITKEYKETREKWKQEGGKKQQDYMNLKKEFEIKIKMLENEINEKERLKRNSHIESLIKSSTPNKENKPQTHNSYFEV